MRPRGKARAKAPALAVQTTKKQGLLESCDLERAERGGLFPSKGRGGQDPCLLVLAECVSGPKRAGLSV